MTTKDQERQAIEKIRKIVEGLGENSYVGFAMDGILELAEDNIREDTAYSMKERAEIAQKDARKAEKGVSLSGILEAEAPQKYFLSKEQTEKIVFK